MVSTQRLCYKSTILDGLDAYIRPDVSKLHTGHLSSLDSNHGWMPRPVIPL